MTGCQHKNRTIDCVCNDCGYDFIVDPMTEKIRFEEQSRIIKLLEEYLSAFGAPQEQLMQRRMTDFIALIKGEK